MRPDRTEEERTFYIECLAKDRVKVLEMFQYADNVAKFDIIPATVTNPHARRETVEILIVKVVLED